MSKDKIVIDMLKAENSYQEKRIINLIKAIKKIPSEEELKAIASKYFACTDSFMAIAFMLGYLVEAVKEAKSLLWNTKAIYWEK